jgi:hypothetical protein
MDTNTTAVAQTWLMNMHRIGLVSFPSLPCHRKMSHSHTPAHYYYTYIPAAAAAAEAQRAAQIKYTHTHTHSSRIPLHANSQHTPPLAFSNAKREILHKTRPHREFFNAARAKEGAEIKFCARERGANSQLQRGNFITQMRRVLSVLCFFILFHVSVAGLF